MTDSKTSVAAVVASNANATPAASATAQEPPSSIAAENRWLAATFGLVHVASEDFYAVAKQQYQLKRFNLAVRCLEIYIGRLSAAQAAAATTAQAVTATQAASTGIGGRGGASKTAFVSKPTQQKSKSSLPVPPLHLLAHAHYSLGSLARARECFLACIRLGFETDWQMLVQVELELSEAMKQAKEREERAGKEAIATLRKHLAATTSKSKDPPAASASSADVEVIAIEAGQDNDDAAPPTIDAASTDEKVDDDPSVTAPESEAGSTSQSVRSSTASFASGSTVWNNRTSLGSESNRDSLIPDSTPFSPLQYTPGDTPLETPLISPKGTIMSSSSTQFEPIPPVEPGSTPEANASIL